jgi:hypothetical protein
MKLAFSIFAILPFAFSSAAVVENLQKPQFYLSGQERAFYGYGLLGYTDGGAKNFLKL